MSLIDVFGATCLGASLVAFSTMPEKLRPGTLIRKHSITFLNIVPQVIDILNKAGQLNQEYCKSLSTIKLGGDKVHISTMEQLFCIMPELTVILTYGPTETTIFCTLGKVNRDSYKNYATDILTIGKPIPGCNIILDNPVDGIGEIVIYGECVGLGYIGKEQIGYDSTEIDGKICRFYRTGDYAKEIQGYYYFCGRRDSQIKINGQRFSLIEIEAALKKAGCDECAVVYFKSIITCFYVDNKHILNEVTLNEYIKQYIPEIFLPKHYMPMNSLPYNANGKIDRAKLNKLLDDK
jgi:acyl-coenzyme A synthetase/AMP-(fatty) acid ligase